MADVTVRAFEFTVTVNEFVSLKLGEPLSITTTVIVFVLGA